MVLARGQAAGVVIWGEPGMGKTTVLDAAVGMAEGARALRAVGTPLEADLPFAGLGELIQPLLPVSRLVPDRQRTVLESALSLDSAQPPDELTVAGAVLAVLAAAAEREPLLIVIDDAQWVDTGSLRAVLFAFRRMRDEPLGVLIASRPTEGRHPVRSAGLREIVLGPLEQDVARAVAASRSTRSRTVADIDRIVRLAAGVPLALIELAEHGHLDSADEFAAEIAPGHATRLVERLFGQRILRLSPSAEMALCLAALGEPGQTGTLVSAGEALGLSSSAWEEAERERILRLSVGKVEFEHPLLRTAVLNRAAPSTRRAAHAALAEALAARGDEFGAAWHRAGAVIGHDAEVAAELERVAETCRGRVGYRAASRALERAADLSVTESDRARCLLLAGESARHAGDQSRGARLAVLAAAASSDPTIAARAEMLQAHGEAWRGSAEAAYRRYRRLAETISSREPELAAHAFVCAAGVATVAGDVRSAMAAAGAAREVAREGLSEPMTMMVDETVALVGALSGESESARSTLDRLATWYEQRPERVGAEYTAEALMWLGDHSRAGRLLDDLVVDSRRLGAMSLLIQSLVLRADLGYRTGSWPAALADASEALALATDTDQTVHCAYAGAMLALLEAVTGEESAAREHAQQARDGARRHALAVVEESACFALGAIEVAAGRPERALTHLLPVAAAVAEAGRDEPGVSLWYPELLEALIGSNRRDDALAALRRLEDCADRTGSAWAQGVAHRYRGVLSERDFDDHFRRAADAHRACGMPFELARTQFCYGQRLRRAGRRIDARAQLREALSTFEALRAVNWGRRCSTELTGAGETARRGPAFDPDQLTPQELQIARVVAAGASNREAAANLFLSPKTIETHLSRIYRKLGVRSRSQLTVMMSGAGGS